MEFSVDKQLSWGEKPREWVPAGKGPLGGSLCQCYRLNQHSHPTAISPIDVFSIQHGWHFFYKNTGKLFCYAHAVSIRWKHNTK